LKKEELEGKIAKLKNLNQYKDKTNDELETLVISQTDKAEQKETTIKEINAIDIEGLFSDIKEKRFARQLLNKYLEEFSIDNISDKSLLKELIYLEVFQKMRLQASADTFQKENGSVPLQMLDSIHKNLDKIVQLKNSLGLSKNSNAEANDAFNAFELLMKKAKIWREENQASRTLVCPHCSQMIMLKIRTHIWEAQKHPYFKDRLLCNAHLIKLYKEKKLSAEDLALILETSPDYIDWMIEKWEKTK
jgi:DNA-directed RNA polymerase subunit RPC12/RpoP